MAIAFGLENPTFLAKSEIPIPKCTEGGRGPPVWEVFLNFYIFLRFPLSDIKKTGCKVASKGSFELLLLAENRTLCQTLGSYHLAHTTISTTLYCITIGVI